MKVLLTQVIEPQMCFPAEDGSTICNWVRKGIYAVSSKNGWMKIPPAEPVIEEDEGEQAEEEVVNEKVPSLQAKGTFSEI